MSSCGISSGRGLSIGSFTSQFFAAHVYFERFDHFVKRDLKVPGLTRYDDDVFCFADRRGDMSLSRSVEHRHRVAVAGQAGTRWRQLSRGNSTLAGVWRATSRL